MDPTQDLKPALPLKTRHNLSVASALAMLQDVGVFYAGDKFTPLEEQDTQCMMDHFPLWWTLLEYSFGAEPMSKARMFPPQLVNDFLAMLQCMREGQEMDQYMQGLLEKQKTYFQRGLSRFDLIIVPIFSEKAHAPHFTMMVLDFSASAKVGIRLKSEIPGAQRECCLRYYDTCHDLKPHTWEAMVEFVSSTLLVRPEDVGEPQRRNQTRQAGEECLFWMCFHIEDEVRHFLGQGWASQGWPSRDRVMKDKRPAPGQPLSVRKHLLAASEVLSKFHQQWKTQFDKRLLQRQEADTLAHEAATAREERRLAIESLREQQGDEAVKLLLERDTGVELPAPPGYPEILTKYKQQRSFQNALETMCRAAADVREASAASAKASASAKAPAAEPKAEAVAPKAKAEPKVLERAQVQAELEEMIFPERPEGMLAEAGWDPEKYFEELTQPALKLWCVRVKERGLGLCTSCHFHGGCFRCEYWMAVRWALRKEGRLLPAARTKRVA